MASVATTNTSRREQLKETLRSLEAFELPDNIQEAFSNDTLDPALIQRYKDARDLYLRRHIQSTFLAHIGTYDGHTIQEVPDRPTEEDEEDAKELLAQVHSEVSQAAQGLHQQTLELKQKYSTFLSRREELKKMIEDMEEDNNTNSNADESIMMAEEDDGEDVDDDALAQEEERLAMLQQKKAQLEVKLNLMRQETANLKLKTDRSEAQVAELLQGADPPSPTAVKQETAETQEKLKKLKDIRDFYDGVRGVLEQLNSIQILEVSNAENETGTAKSSSDNGKDDGSAPSRATMIRVRVMEKHEIQITLRASNPQKLAELRVADAKFLTSTVVRAPVDGSASASSEDDEDSNKVLKLTIPPLDDLVRLCAMFPPGEELRFLLREAMGRIRMIEARVVELAILHNNVLTKIGTFQHDNDGFGGEEQEVVCSMNECITVVLRLTADCPNVPGSVYISQMVGVCGWDDETVHKIKETVLAQDFKSPWALIQAIQGEIARLQKDEGLALPKTPTLPLRRKKA